MILIRADFVDTHFAFLEQFREQGQLSEVATRPGMEVSLENAMLG